MDLDQIKDRDCFNVPDTYFDELPKVVMNKIAKQKKVVLWQRATIAVASVAASLLLIVGIINLRPDSVETMTAQTEDSIAKAASIETILTAEVKPDNEVVEENNSETYSQAVINSPKTNKRVAKMQAEQLEDVDYQIVDMYLEEIEMNEYLLSLY